jgi:hypothetical protein
MTLISNIDRSMDREIAKESKGQHNPKVMSTNTSCMNLFAIRFTLNSNDEDGISLSAMEDE